MSYKRNQIEEAVARLIGEEQPSSQLRIRLKRLLDADRALGRKPRANDPSLANYAFYSSEEPGKGVEVEFTGYEAFALLTSLRLLHHGWPQGFAVDTLRRVRPELEPQHDRTLRQDPRELFNETRLRDEAKPGAFAFDNTDPILLVIVSGNNPDNVELAVSRGSVPAFEFLKVRAGRPWTFHELATSAHRLRNELSKTQPRKRGRSK